MNILVQEAARAYYTGWHRELVAELPIVEEGSGLGTELLPGLQECSDASLQTSELGA